MTQSQEVIEELYDCYTKTAANIISYFNGDERKKKLEELRDIVKNNCIQDAKLKKAEEIKDRLLTIYDDDETTTSIEGIIKEYKVAIAEINTDITRDSKLLEYDRQVEALSHGNEDAGEDNSDEDLQLTGGYMNVIDPISKKRIVDPVKNVVCLHTYDRETITQTLKINKKTRCPVIGCTSTEFVKLSKLRPDVAMKAYLEKNPG